MARLITFLKNKTGATAIEYGLIASLISIASILALKAVGSNLTTTFNHIAANLSR